MSEISCWRARPAAREVYDARMREEKRSNARLLSQGIYFTAGLFGVFGVCLGNLELMCASALMALLAKAVR